MTEAISYINNSLKAIYPESETRGFVRLIMERVCGLQPYQLLLGKGNDLSDKEKAEIVEIVGRLQKSEPIQYIFGIADFCGYEFAVSPAVLIPRPETAELVAKVRADAGSTTPLRLLDIGTGSGCIAITLAKQIRQAEVYAMDISEEALAVARQNAKALQADVRFIREDILSETAIHAFRKRNVNRIVSNPPYVMEEEKTAMDANVLNYEPHLALFVPNQDPLRFYRAIADFGKACLPEDGLLYFEINARCGEATKQLLLEKGYKNIELTQDIYGKDRIIKAAL